MQIMTLGSWLGRGTRGGSVRMTASRRDKETAGLARMTSWRRPYSAYTEGSGPIQGERGQTVCLDMWGFTVKQRVFKNCMWRLQERHFCWTLIVPCVIFTNTARGKVKTPFSVVTKKKKIRNTQSHCRANSAAAVLDCAYCTRVVLYTLWAHE